MMRRARLADAMGLGPLWLPRGVELVGDDEAYEVASTPDRPAAAIAPGRTPLPPPPGSASPLRKALLSKVQGHSRPAPSVVAQADTPFKIVERTTLGSAKVEIAALDWTGLQQAVSVCQRCRLCETRTQTVFGRGAERARLMIVGEAPGENEDKEGQPFVGRAGRLLENMLASISLNSESDVFITNVLKCRPPGNRNPAGDEIASCQNYLLAQIEHVRPDLILALGRFAAQTLLESTETIGRLRGRVHRYRDIPLIVSYHPAYLLRNQPDKARAWQDLTLTRRTLIQLAAS
ncbi:uracil-DNA glycosylase [Crenobacter cavernae]|uniref:Type-4 uracil-DNA glycosylase n=1 Tax=Crenobacter cavernae TaxID=2290923 RepID=A0ABY0FFI4_9NEIS|nr:uracil-DNA glycosylase [Crenobacter cavernae]RXZ45070.1 uracil-DNA glycosylase [Crenobacter cavernae]